MGSCRCDRSHRESQLGRIDHRRRRRITLRRSAALPRSGTNVAVKIPGRERYVTDSRTAAKPSSDFTIHGCQAFRTLFLVNLLQTNQIELQNNLHSPRTSLTVFDWTLCGMSVCGWPVKVA